MADESSLWTSEFASYIQTRPSYNRVYRLCLYTLRINIPIESTLSSIPFSMSSVDFKMSTQKYRRHRHNPRLFPMRMHFRPTNHTQREQKPHCWLETVFFSEKDKPSRRQNSCSFDDKTQLAVCSLEPLLRPLFQSNPRLTYVSTPDGNEIFQDAVEFTSGQGDPESSSIVPSIQPNFQRILAAGTSTAWNAIRLA